MAVPVHAPRFDVQECRDDVAREFVERLHQRAERGDWYADSWSHLRDRVVIAVTLTDRERRLALRTLRADYVGPHLLLGEDETQQFATDLDPARPGVTLVTEGRPQDLADAAADWLEREMARPVVRHEWMAPGREGVVWAQADNDRELVWSTPGNTRVGRMVGPPEKTTLVSGRLVQPS